MNEKLGKNRQGMGPQIINKKAFHNFEVVEAIEAGMELLGTEVKSLRDRQADLEGAYGRIQQGQCWLLGCKIAQYPQAGGNNHEPLRKRKLLLHKRQIVKLTGRLEQRGFTLVPLRFYFNQRGYAKVQLGLCRGKRQYDKRRIIQDREQKKDLDRSTKKYKRR